MLPYLQNPCQTTICQYKREIENKESRAKDKRQIKLQNIFQIGFISKKIGLKAHPHEI